MIVNRINTIGSNSYFRILLQYSNTTNNATSTLKRKLFLHQQKQSSFHMTNNKYFFSSSTDSSAIHKKTSLALSSSSKNKKGLLSKNNKHEINNNNSSIDDSSNILLTNDATTTRNKKNEADDNDNTTVNEKSKTTTDTQHNAIKEKEEDLFNPYQMNEQSNYNLHGDFSPKILVIGIGGAGGNAINNMIHSSSAQGGKVLTGVDFLTINTDVQHLRSTLTDNQLQIGSSISSGLGCGANPDTGRLAAEESKDEIIERIKDAHMVFLTAGMGGGTGTGATPIISELCYQHSILTVAVVTKPFRFEGTHRMRLANEGISRLKNIVDTLIVIPNQNLFTISNESTSLIDAFQLADDVLLAGVKSITDLMTNPGLINLDFADVQTVMSGMGNAMLGTGQSSNTVENRAIEAAEQAIHNPLLHSNETKMDISTAKGMLVNISGGKDMTLFEVDKAALRVTECLKDPNANIIFGSSYDESLEGSIRVSVVATGIDDDDDNNDGI